MRIKLSKISLENFKCFDEFTFNPEGKNARLRGANGTGKTAVREGVLWLHTNKDSEGRTSLDHRPVYTDPQSPQFGERIKGLVVAVEIEWLINSEAHTFRKEEKEVITVKKVGGIPREDIKYTSKYWIDELPKNEGDFKEYFNNICPADKFRMLTDLDFFNNDKKNPWLKARRTLQDMAGEIEEPEGFEDVTS